MDIKCTIYCHATFYILWHARYFNFNQFSLTIRRFLAHLADYAWTYELRDTGDFGFALPANQIKSCCEETTASLRVLHQLMADEIVDRKMARKDNGKITEDEWNKIECVGMNPFVCCPKCCPTLRSTFNQTNFLSTILEIRFDSSNANSK